MSLLFQELELGAGDPLRDGPPQLGPARRVAAAGEDERRGGDLGASDSTSTVAVISTMMSAMRASCA
jgi:hypothetical protein